MRGRAELAVVLGPAGCGIAEREAGACRLVLPALALGGSHLVVHARADQTERLRQGISPAGRAPPLEVRLEDGALPRSRQVPCPHDADRGPETAEQHLVDDGTSRL